MKTERKQAMKMLGMLAFSTLLSVSTFGQAKGELTNIQQITRDGNRYVNLKWSPDGTKLAFAKEGYAEGLDMIEMATQKRTKITEMTDAGMFYSWSADSKEVLFRDTKWEGKERTHTLYVVDLQGKKQQVSEPQRYLQPASWNYLTDGTKRVFTKDGTIKTQPILPKLSKTMIKSTFEKRPNISTYNDTETMKFYLIDENGKQILLCNDLGLVPAVSPNGKKIVYNENNYMILVDTNGKNRRDLGKGYRANWLNDNQIVFERTTDDGHEYTSGELWIMNIDGTGLKQITNTPDKIEMYPTFNEKTQKLAFISQIDGQIYTADLK